MREYGLGLATMLNLRQSTLGSVRSCVAPGTLPLTPHRSLGTHEWEQGQARPHPHLQTERGGRGGSGRKRRVTMRKTRSCMHWNFYICMAPRDGNRSGLGATIRTQLFSRSCFSSGYILGCIKNQSPLFDRVQSCRVPACKQDLSSEKKKREQTKNRKGAWGEDRTHGANSDRSPTTCYFAQTPNSASFQEYYVL